LLIASWSSDTENYCFPSSLFLCLAFYDLKKFTRAKNISYSNPHFSPHNLKSTNKFWFSVKISTFDLINTRYFLIISPKHKVWGIFKIDKIEEWVNYSALKKGAFISNKMKLIILKFMTGGKTIYDFFKEEKKTRKNIRNFLLILLSTFRKLK
jgi:hypothetical protein